MPTSPRTPRQRRGIKPPLCKGGWDCLHRLLALSFRASDRRHWRGNPFPAPAGAELPPPSVREVSTRSVDGWIVTSGRGRAPPLHTSADSLCAIRAGGCGHRPYEITGDVCVIRTGGQSPRAPTTAYRQQKHFPKQRPKAATNLCRFAAKARFDKRPPPGGCFQRGRAAALPLWSFQGDRIFKERGKSKSPFPSTVLWLLSFGKESNPSETKKRKGPKSPRAG